DAGGDVHLTRTIGTRPRAQTAADAHVLIDEDNAVFSSLVGRASRTDRDARRIFAVKAGFGEMDDPRVPCFADEFAVLGNSLVRVDAIEKGAGHLRAVRVLIRQSRAIAAGVPFLA